MKLEIIGERFKERRMSAKGFLVAMFVYPTTRGILTVAEIAKILGCSRDGVVVKIYRGYLEPGRIKAKIGRPPGRVSSDASRAKKIDTIPSIGTWEAEQCQK